MRRFSSLFLDGRSRTMVVRRGMWHNTNIGARNPRWVSMCQWYANTFSSAEPFDRPLIRHVVEVANVRRLYTLFWRYREVSTEVKIFYWLSSRCYEPRYDKFYLVRDALKLWHELGLEHWQRKNMRDASSLNRTTSNCLLFRLGSVIYSFRWFKSYGLSAKVIVTRVFRHWSWLYR